jgi:hypothetical protein
MDGLLVGWMVCWPVVGHFQTKATSGAYCAPALVSIQPFSLDLGNAYIFVIKVLSEQNLEQTNINMDIDPVARMESFRALKVKTRMIF